MTAGSSINRGLKREATDESLGSKNLMANSLMSNQDDELIEELARTCFKSAGFYKPSSDDA